MGHCYMEKTCDNKDGNVKTRGLKRAWKFEGIARHILGTQIEGTVPFLPQVLQWEWGSLHCERRRATHGGQYVAFVVPS